MIYVYAVTDPPPEPSPPITGMDDQPTELLLTHGIAVAISRHTHGRFTATADHVCRHERVIEAFMHDRAVLPARFGTTFREDHDLHTAIGSRADALVAGLNKVRGCVELGVRVLANDFATQPASDPAPSIMTTSGRAWMLARLDRERQTERNRQADESLASSLHQPLAALARDARLELRPSRFLATAAYLVPRDKIDPFTATVRSLTSAHPDLRILCTGPWPPYNFSPALHNATSTHV